ncbi:MAG: NADH-quinone oxidoreductase subunit J [Polyangia bacterium]|nr:NADH-quinone oxidoreductase subunit J [Polyangia bacterium]
MKTSVALALLAGLVALGPGPAAAQPQAPPQRAPQQQAPPQRAPQQQALPQRAPQQRVPGLQAGQQQQAPQQQALPQRAPGLQAPEQPPARAVRPQPALPQASERGAMMPVQAPLKERIAQGAHTPQAKAGEYALSGARGQMARPKKDFLGLVVFFLLAFGCAGFSLVMITRKSPMMAALSLLVVFLCLAGLYVLLKAPFMAAIQLIVYAGAVIVLFVFVIMSMGLQEAYSRTQMAKDMAYFMGGFLLTGCAALVAQYAEGLGALALAGLLLAGTAALFVLYLKYPFTRFLGMAAAAFAAMQIMRLGTLTGVVMELPAAAAKDPTRLLPVAAPLAEDFGSPKSVGRSIFVENAFAFEALSLLLLAAIVAAVVIVRSRKEEAK